MSRGKTMPDCSSTKMPKKKKQRCPRVASKPTHHPGPYRRIFLSQLKCGKKLWHLMMVLKIWTLTAYLIILSNYYCFRDNGDTVIKFLKDPYWNITGSVMSGICFGVLLGRRKCNGRKINKTILAMSQQWKIMVK